MNTQEAIELCVGTANAAAPDRRHFAASVCIVFVDRSSCCLAYPGRFEARAKHLHGGFGGNFTQLYRAKMSRRCQCPIAHRAPSLRHPSDPEAPAVLPNAPSRSRFCASGVTWAGAKGLRWPLLPLGSIFVCCLQHPTIARLRSLCRCALHSAG